MSASAWDWSLASAEGLLTNEECSMLLDADILNEDQDLFKTFPAAGAKVVSHCDYPVQDDVSSLYPSSPEEIKPNPCQLASDFLQQLDNQCKPENIFSEWLEEKAVPIQPLPQEQLVPAAQPAPLSYPAQAPAQTAELLREFETVYDAMEISHLTPPQSPPGPATQLLINYAQGVHYPPGWAAITAPQSNVEIDRGVEEVDELVRHRASQLTSVESSPRSSPSSSPRSSSTDEEWVLGAGGRPSRGYTRTTEDRRSRKKEQNKNAATRYRQKKKAEVEVLLQEESALRQRHSDLNNKCSDLQREIRYLKGLMRDLFKAKGLIK